MQLRLNDPAVPIHIPYSAPPEARTLSFNIKGYTNILSKTEIGMQSANCYVYLTESINYTENIIKKFRHMPTKWAAITGNLPVNPRAGKDFNAYYNRSSLKFFYAPDPKRKKMVYTADSTDIISHEMGHAVLDTLRPDFWNVQSLEIWALHEAFGDIVAITSMMVHGAVLHTILDETGGNLRHSNVASRLAEELGGAVYNTMRGRNGFKPNYLRDATVKYGYVNPDTLPEDAPDDRLAAESHSFSRIFVSAWYELFVRFFEKNISVGIDSISAMQKARDMAYLLVLRGICEVPKVPRIFEALVKTMMNIDTSEGSINYNILKDVFSSWNLYKPTVKMLSVKHVDDLNDGTFDVQTFADFKILKKTHKNKTKLSDLVISSLSLKEDPIVELASDECYMFNKNGYLFDEIKFTQNEILDDAQYCLNNFVIGQLGGTWVVRNGKLQRNHIRCCGHS